MNALVKHARLFVGLRGVLAILFGVAAVAWPGITLLSLIILFGVYSLIDGGATLFNSVYYRKVLHSSWLVLLSAVCSIAVGALALVWPLMTGLVLLMVIAIRAIIVGGLEIVGGILHHRELTDSWLLVVAGAISVLFGFAVLVYPFSGALAIVWLIAFYAILYGIGQIAFAAMAGKHIRPTDYGAPMPV